MVISRFIDSFDLIGPGFDKSASTISASLPS